MLYDAVDAEGSVKRRSAHGRRCATALSAVWIFDLHCSDTVYHIVTSSMPHTFTRIRHG